MRWANPRCIASQGAMKRLNASVLNASHVLVIDVIKAILVDILLNSGHGDVRNSLITVEDTRDLLKSRALGLREDEVYPDELDSNPQLRDSQYSL